jgi:hypothetical protein
MPFDIDFNDIKVDYRTRELLRNIDTVVIDEVSMLSWGMLYQIDKNMRLVAKHVAKLEDTMWRQAAKNVVQANQFPTRPPQTHSGGNYESNNVTTDFSDEDCRPSRRDENLPFGGFRVICTGDFFQLPAVASCLFDELPDRFTDRDLARTVHAAVCLMLHESKRYLDKELQSTVERMIVYNDPAADFKTPLSNFIGATSELRAIDFKPSRDAVEKYHRSITEWNTLVGNSDNHRRAVVKIDDDCEAMETFFAEGVAPRLKELLPDVIDGCFVLGSDEYATKWKDRRNTDISPDNFGVNSTVDVSKLSTVEECLDDHKNIFFDSAHYLVTTNAECDLINLIEAIKEATRRKVALICIRRSPNYSNPLVEPGAFNYFIAGVQIRLTSNLAQKSLEAANGSLATLDRIHLSEEGLARVANCHRPGQLVVLTEKDVHAISVTLDNSAKQKIDLVFDKSNAGGTHAIINPVLKSVRSRAKEVLTGRNPLATGIDKAPGGFPYALNFAMTFYRAQGQTLHKIIIVIRNDNDLINHQESDDNNNGIKKKFAGRPGGGGLRHPAVYVALTRARKFSDIRILGKATCSFSHVLNLRPSKNVVSFMHNLRILNPREPPNGYTNIAPVQQPPPPAILNNNNNNNQNVPLNNNFRRVTTRIVPPPPQQQQPLTTEIPIFSTTSTTTKKVLDYASANNALVTFSDKPDDEKNGIYTMPRQHIVAFNNIVREQLVRLGTIDIDDEFFNNDNGDSNFIFEQVDRQSILDRLLDKQQAEIFYTAKKHFEVWFSQNVDTAFLAKKKEGSKTTTNNNNNKSKNNAMFEFGSSLEKARGDPAGYFKDKSMAKNGLSVSEHAARYVVALLKHLHSIQQNNTKTLNH